MTVIHDHSASTRRQSAMSGGFVSDDGDHWYRIEHYDAQPPFFIALTGDSDLWAFVSTTGSLAAGRRDADNAFFPYETVDKIHRRWQFTGPRSWILIGAENEAEASLWQPFAPRLCGGIGRRSLWKNLSGTRLRFREEHPDGKLAFEYEWSSAAGLGLVRTARLECLSGKVSARVLDGLLNLLPPGVSAEHANSMSCLTDAYKWNESAAGGRLGIFTLYAQIWDRAEPKESFEALTCWHAGLPANARTLLSDHQVGDFCRGAQIRAEALTRGRRGAFLVNFDARLDAASTPAIEWCQVVDGPMSQVRSFELARRLEDGGGTLAEIRSAIARNTQDVDALLVRADGIQQSGDPMAAAHHRANVLFNIMRGGVFVDGSFFDRADLLAFAAMRHRQTGQRLADAAADQPQRLHRDAGLDLAREVGAQAERLVLEYLPLTFSRRHGDPSRPWNKFSIRVRDEAGRRIVNYQGNWRDIFQNWEALASSEPAYLGSMIAVFLGAMTPDGYNPYRVSRDGIDWEVPEPDNPWSHIGYWGDHQVIYLLRLLEAIQAREPSWLDRHWNRELFSFADVPYRLKPHAEQLQHPKHTIEFDAAAHDCAMRRAAAIGNDGLRVCDADGLPVLASLGEKLALILLAKAGSLVPGGGLWLHTQRPEWNDANNALAGNGLSIVTLAYLRRFLGFLKALPAAAEPFALPQNTLQAMQGLHTLLRQTPLDAVSDEAGRRRFIDAIGPVLDAWRDAAYRGSAGRIAATAPAGLLPQLADALLPLIDATLAANRRDDGLFHSYNLIDFSAGGARIDHLYPMLEGQVAMLSSGLLAPADAQRLLEALFASPLYDARRNTFLLYPDRQLAGFLERNRLDAEALALPVTQAILAQGRTDLLQQQSDGTVRFAPRLSNRADLEAAGADLGAALQPLCQAYERLLGHHAFTGRSGTMFGYEGLGCVYWHMVAKLLLAVQENVFIAADRQAPELESLKAFYRRVRDGLGYRKDPASFGAFPADPYSHTPGEGGARQPGMTGQVKEEILTRWGELGLRVKDGRVFFDPVLLDAAELPDGGALHFTWAQVPYTYRRDTLTRLRIRTADGWQDCPTWSFDPHAVLAVEADVAV